MMMMPSIFGGNLFNDDWMDFSFPDIDKELYGKHAKNLMKTDVKEKDGNYEVAIDLPGFKKDEITAELKDGYLTISAAKGLDKDEKDKEGDYLLNRDFTAKWGYTLLGKDVYCSDAMDKMLAGKTAIYYGDFSGLAVKVSENANMQVLQERYAEEHLLGILAFVEWDAKVADTQKLAKLVMMAGK